MQLSSKNWEVHPNRRIYNGKTLLAPDMVVRFQTKNYCIKPTIDEIKDAYVIQWRLTDIWNLSCSVADFVCKPL